MDRNENNRPTHRMARYGYAGASRGVGSQPLGGTAPAPAHGLGASRAAVLNVSTATFAQEVLVASQSVPVLVDCHTTWCGPCRGLAPHLEALAGELQGRLKVVKVDGDADPAVIQKYGVRTYPTLLLFSGGQLVNTHPGSPGSLNGLLEFVGPLP